MGQKRDRDHAAISREQAREFQARWKAVALIEAQEQQAATFNQRWQQLNAILRLAKELQLPLVRSDEEIATVRKRWVRLRASKGGHDAG